MARQPLWCPTLLVLALPALLPAQERGSTEPPAAWVATIIAGLRHADAAVVANHAAVIARHRLAVAAEPLQAALGAWQQQPGEPARFARLLLADALCALPGKVASARIAPLFTDPITRIPAFLLACRDLDASRGPLTGLAKNEDQEDMVALGAAMALCAHRPPVPGLAAHLCRSDSLTLEVTVHDDREVDRGAWRAQIEGSLRAPAGFPPLPQHRLALSVARLPDTTCEAVPATGEPHPLFHTRAEGASIDSGEVLDRSGAPLAPDPSRRLQMALFPRAEPSRRPRLHHNLRWHDAARLCADIADLRADQMRRLDELLARLRQDGWLATDELVGFHWQLRIVLRDARGDTSVPLPAIPQAAPPPASGTTDLRPRFAEFGLPPRGQGARPTCSIFTTVSAFEFALALVRGRGERLSVEYANWAANAATGRADDGDFFHHALAGFERFGSCAEALHPYGPAFAGAAPPPEALVAGGRLLAGDAKAIAVRWIRPIGGGPGLSAEQFAEVVRTLDTGLPVAVGAAHSRLLIGHRQDPAAAGGSMFWTLDSGTGAFGEVTAEYVRTAICDAFVVEPVGFGARTGG